LRVHRIGFRHGASFELLPPCGDVAFDRVRPLSIFFTSDKREERFECIGGIAVQVYFCGVPQRKHRGIDIDLHGAGAAILGQEFGPRETGPDHQEGVATLHQVPTRLGAQQSDGARNKRKVIG
jgi:hypothetical protein